MLERCLYISGFIEFEYISGFQNLLCDCALEARIWQKVHPLPSIPDVKLQKCFDLVSRKKLPTTLLLSDHWLEY